MLLKKESVANICGHIDKCTSAVEAQMVDVSMDSSKLCPICEVR